MRRVIDCGFVVGVLELTEDDKPMLTLMQPEEGDSEAKSISVWHPEGLENLCDALREYLDAWTQRQIEKDRELLRQDLPQ